MSPRWGDAKEAARCRADFLERNALPNTIVQLSIPSPNGAQIESVDDVSVGVVVADALMTETPGLVLGLYTADCAPVAAVDTVRGLAGLAHCGWESTGLKLARRLVTEMFARGCAPASMCVSIGPSIQKESYVQSKEKVSQLADSDWAPFLELRGGNVHIDLQGYIVAQCLEAGVPRGQIRTSPRDSYKDMTCFSHRRAVEHGTPEGRMLTVVSLVL